ncbi:MAG: GNAT family N-acetyltransferase [Paludibacter sp.]
MYLSNLLEKGIAILWFEKSIPKACLLYTSLTNDKACPSEIRSNFILESSAYIAEIMVDEDFRGRGIGKILINTFLETADRTNYTDAFIRVWDGNLPALNLYKNAGFIPFCSIDQMKKTVDGKTDLLMRKIYLHKNLTDL